uniref:Metalloendopeptidase n=1 Tax=Strongyloides stercoralis TaxID=6248 RepID=A0AAF5D3N9_STRER
MIFKKALENLSDWGGINVITQAYYSKNKKILTLWILFIISMNLFAVYSVMKIFANRKPIVKLRTTREMFSDKFPYVTICFDIIFKHDKFDDYDIEKNNPQSPYDNNFSNAIQYSSFRDSKITDLLTIECSYQGDNCNKIMLPMKTNKDLHQSCLIFDFSNEKYRFFSRIGKNFGLSLFLSNKISEINQHYQKALGYDPILAIYYSLNDNKDARDFKFHKNIIPLGYETNIPIVISREIRNSDTSECYNYNEQKGKNHFNEYSNSFETCFMNCLRTKELNECPAPTPFNPVACLKLICMCKTDECLNCSSNLIFPERKDSKLFRPGFIKSCSCEYPCNYYIYKTSPSHAKLHTKNMIKRFDLKGNYDDLKVDIEANYAIVNLFIKEKEIVTKRQAVIGSTANLFSDIGNTLSLLLGLGMINFIEIFFSIFGKIGRPWFKHQVFGVHLVFLCNGIPYNNVQTKVYDYNVGIYSRIGGIPPDENGNLYYNGLVDGYIKFDPYIYFYHQCNVPNPLCEIEAYLHIPREFVNDGTTPKRRYTNRTFELNWIHPGQREKCRYHKKDLNVPYPGVNETITTTKLPLITTTTKSLCNRPVTSKKPKPSKKPKTTKKPKPTKKPKKKPCKKNKKGSKHKIHKIIKETYIRQEITIKKGRKGGNGTNEENKTEKEQKSFFFGFCKIKESKLLYPGFIESYLNNFFIYNKKNLTLTNNKHLIYVSKRYVKEKLRNNSNLVLIKKLKLLGVPLKIKKMISDQIHEFSKIIYSDLANSTLLDTNERVKRKFRRNVTSRWGNPIYYTLDSPCDFNSVKLALRQIQKQTCLVFIPITNIKKKHKEVLRFTSKGKCGTKVGKTIKNGTHRIHLSEGCNSIGDILRFTLNALGIYDEHRRNDRDFYVYFYLENVMKDKEKFFARVPAEDTYAINLPYDYGSVTQAGSYYFSKSKQKKTIVPKMGLYEHTIGQQERLSFLDVQFVNQLYCQKKCLNKITCQNEGYPDPNHCHVCRCVDGFTGPDCTKPLKQSHNCGSTFVRVNPRTGYLKLMGTKFCTIHLLAERNRIIQMSIVSSSLYPNDHNTCSFYNSFEVKYRNLKSATGARFCTTTANKMIQSENGHVILQYRSTNKKNWVRMLFRSKISKKLLFQG